MGDRIILRVVLSPDSETAPLSLWYNILIKMEATAEVKVREKAYGLLISGPKDEVERIASEVRRIDPSRIFIEESSPPIKGHKVFRGFLQLSGELRTLPLISQALQDASVDSELRVDGRLVRCRYIDYRPIALLMDYGNERVRVRCPEMMMLYGSHACGYRCPYGELIYT